MKRLTHHGIHEREFQAECLNIREKRGRSFERQFRRGAESFEKLELQVSPPRNGAAHRLHQAPFFLVINGQSHV